MRVGAGFVSAGIAALLLTAGCKEGKLLQEGEQASATESGQPAVREARQELAETELRAQAEAPQPEAQAPAQGEQLIVGEVLTASEQALLVSVRGEPQLRLQLNPSTEVIVDGRQGRATDIQEGSQVRASYRDSEGEPTAVRIEVTSSMQPPAPASPESGESSPGAQPVQPRSP